jgi:hypothetical protein
VPEHAEHGGAEPHLNKETTMKTMLATIAALLMAAPLLADEKGPGSIVDITIGGGAGGLSTGSTNASGGGGGAGGSVSIERAAASPGGLYFGSDTACGVGAGGQGVLGGGTIAGMHPLCQLQMAMKDCQLSEPGSSRCVAIEDAYYELAMSSSTPLGRDLRHLGSLIRDVFFVWTW